MQFMVQTTYNGNTFWLKKFTWTSEQSRGNVYASREAAQAALDKSKQFNAAAAHKAARIIEVQF